MRPLQDSSQYLEGESATEYNEIWNILVEFLNQEFEDAIGKIHRDTLNITPTPIIKDFSKISPKKGQVQIQTKTIQSRIDMITAALESGTLTEGQQKILEKIYDEIIVETSKLSQQAQTALSEMGAVGKNTLLDLSETKNLIKTINKAAGISTGLTNLQKGTLFEYLIAVAPLIGQGLTGKALRDAVYSAIGGNGPMFNQVLQLSQASGMATSSVRFDPNSFLSLSNEAWSNILGSNYHLNDSIFVANKPTQDKVDVTISFTPGGKQYRVSAKNVNITGRSAQPIHLVQGMSFLSALSNIKSHEFVNHYLNQHVARVPYSLQSMFAASEAVLNLSIMEQAWRGYKSSAAQADVMLVNNNMTGEIEIINIGDILEDLFDGTESLNLLNIDPNVNRLIFPMEWSEVGAYDRIAKILAAVHNVKLSVTLNPSLFGGGS